jgi:hypothetical protein
MPYSIQLLLLIASLPPRQSDQKSQASGSGEADVRQVIEPVVDKVCQLVAAFLQRRLTPTQVCHFEQQLREQVRELARLVSQWTYQQAEPAVATLPKHVWFEGLEYTRLNEKTRQNVWTLFGQVRLGRVGYRPTNKTGDATIFPLALSLGLVQGATPALAERASWYLGRSGMTQSQTLERLRQDHGVGWGVKKLRQVTGAVATALAAQAHDSQVDKLLELLKQASVSTGRHKPVLSVGRDGITLGTRCKGGSVFEVATTGTVTVLDRRGRRLGTVYLAYTPEFGQKTMSNALTRLLEEVLRRWDAPLPHLCYVTDAGDSETTYYDKVLKRMKHPVTGATLAWIRVVDYYHASERVWTMAELLFDKGQRATSWARKMQKWLLKPVGVNRVLHSAAALRDLYRLRGKKLAEFGKAYRYLRDRMKYMHYADYKALGIPCGSGVTEAACKTVYTQRLKLSGMRWTRPGAQVILNLRVLQLSGVWQAAYAAVLQRFDEPQVRGQATRNVHSARKAA